MGTLTSPDRCVDKTSDGKATEETVDEELGKIILEKPDIKNILSFALGSVVAADESYSFSDCPFTRPSELAAVRHPCTTALIDELIWELT